MKILNAKFHGFVDFAVVAAFLTGPALLGFSGLPMKLSYALAAIHSGLILTTIYPFGLIKLVPFTVHGMIEFVVAIGLVAFPWVLGFSSEEAARNFYVAAGVAVFLTRMTTDYKSSNLTLRKG